MDAKTDILTRTFGIEIEMCDFDRSQVTIPNDFEWNKDEEIYNTNGVCNSKYGGEINTPPLIFCEESFERINGVYEELEKAGGKLKWSIDTHVHLYAGDLTLEQLKQLVVFQYCTYPFFREYTNLGDWDEVALHGKPFITEEKFTEIKNADSLSKLKNILTNQSKKGFVRYAINVASYFVRSTVEFRCYNATTDFELVKNCVIATYKMFYYALSHTEEEFLAINSLSEFISVLELPQKTPPIICPLIYQGNPYSAKEAFMTKPVNVNAKTISSLVSSLEENGVNEIAIVNSCMFQFELNLWRKFKIRCYNQDSYNHLLYKLSKGETVVRYSNDLSWLEEYNSEDNVRQVAIALYVFRIMKYVKASNDYSKTMLAAYKEKAEESIIKTEATAKNLIEMLNSIDYINGNLQTAISESKTIVFSFGKYKRSNRAVRTIIDNSDYESDIEVIPNEYYELIESLPADSLFYMFSNSPYLYNMHKLALFRNSGQYREDAGKFLYCNKKQSFNKSETKYTKLSGNVNILIPPDDLIIDDPSKLSIRKIYSSELFNLQKRFIKKVDKVMRCTFAYAIMYDEYCLGAVGFDFPKSPDYDLWQVSDFCTNNNIPRLSKLILFAILSDNMQRILSRELKYRIESVITYAYTDSPVSMKYRGAYVKEDDKCSQGKLAYVGVLGKYGSFEECLKTYNKSKQNAGKRR